MHVKRIVLIYFCRRTHFSWLQGEWFVVLTFVLFCTNLLGQCISLIRYCPVSWKGLLCMLTDYIYRVLLSKQFSCIARRESLPPRLTWTPLKALIWTKLGCRKRSNLTDPQHTRWHLTLIFLLTLVSTISCSASLWTWAHLLQYFLYSGSTLGLHIQTIFGFLIKVLDSRNYNPQY